MPLKFSEEYRRHLPHIVPLNGTFHVVFRVKNSIPTHMIKSLVKEYEVAKEKIVNTTFTKKERIIALNELQLDYFENFENELHKSTIKPLEKNERAKIVQYALHQFDGKRYRLVCYSIMPNHVHVLFMNVKMNLAKILKSIKGYSAYLINKLDLKNGTFWQDESYDHMVTSRNELAETIAYILYNPVKSGICNHYSEHVFAWCSEEYAEI